MEKAFKNINKSEKALSSYYLLLVGDLLSKELNKCIFLDVDICVCKDLSELFNIDIKDNYIAEVSEPDYYLSEEQNCKRLNISSMKQYVNLGMLIMNLKQMRRNNMTQKFIELSIRNYELHNKCCLLRKNNDIISYI